MSGRVSNQTEIDQAVADNELRQRVHASLDRLAWGHKVRAKRDDPALVADDIATYDDELFEYHEIYETLIPFVIEWQAAQTNASDGFGGEWPETAHV